MNNREINKAVAQIAIETFLDGNYLSPSMRKQLIHYWPRLGAPYWQVGSFVCILFLLLGICLQFYFNQMEWVLILFLPLFCHTIYTSYTGYELTKHRTRLMSFTNAVHDQLELNRDIEQMFEKRKIQTDIWRKEHVFADMDKQLQENERKFIAEYVDQLKDLIRYKQDILKQFSARGVISQSTTKIPDMDILLVDPNISIHLLQDQIKRMFDIYSDTVQIFTVAMGIAITKNIGSEVFHDIIYDIIPNITKQIKSLIYLYERRYNDLCNIANDYYSNPKLDSTEGPYFNAITPLENYISQMEVLFLMTQQLEGYLQKESVPVGEAITSTIVELDKIRLSCHKSFQELYGFVVSQGNEENVPPSESQSDTRSQLNETQDDVKSVDTTIAESVINTKENEEHGGFYRCFVTDDSVSTDEYPSSDEAEVHAALRKAVKIHQAQHLDNQANGRDQIEHDLIDFSEKYDDCLEEFCDVENQVVDDNEEMKMKDFVKPQEKGDIVDEV